MTRQQRYESKNLKAGKCVHCGKARFEKSKIYCLDCLFKRRERRSKKLGYKSWYETGRGRPPLEAGD